jgi:hypothetical protein
MEDFYEFEIRVSDMVDDFIRQFPKVYADKVGLDYRCGYVYVGEDFIAVSTDNDNRLQYYGGFEYISKELRKQYGEYVFYTAEDDECRVSECLEWFNSKTEEKADA